MKGRTFFVSILLALSTVGCEREMMSKSLINDLKSLRAADRRTDIDITDLVLEYLPEGSSKSVALAFLAKNHFQVVEPGKPQKDNSTIETLVARRRLKEGVSLGFYDEVRIVVQFSDQVAVDVTAKLFYHSL